MNDLIFSSLSGAVTNGSHTFEFQFTGDSIQITSMVATADEALAIIRHLRTPPGTEAVAAPTPTSFKDEDSGVAVHANIPVKVAVSTKKKAAPVAKVVSTTIKPKPTRVRKKILKPQVAAINDIPVRFIEANLEGDYDVEAEADKNWAGIHTDHAAALIDAWDTHEKYADDPNVTVVGSVGDFMGAAVAAVEAPAAAALVAVAAAPPAVTPAADVPDPDAAAKRARFDAARAKAAGLTVPEKVEEPETETTWDAEAEFPEDEVVTDYPEVPFELPDDNNFFGLVTTFVEHNITSIPRITAMLSPYIQKHPAMMAVQDQEDLLKRVENAFVLVGISPTQATA